MRTRVLACVCVLLLLSTVFNVSAVSKVENSFSWVSTGQGEGGGVVVQDVSTGADEENNSHAFICGGFKNSLRFSKGHEVVGTNAGTAFVASITSVGNWLLLWAPDVSTSFATDRSVCRNMETVENTNDIYLVGEYSGTLELCSEGTTCTATLKLLNSGPANTAVFVSWQTQDLLAKALVGLGGSKGNATAVGVVIDDEAMVVVAGDFTGSVAMQASTKVRSAFKQRSAPAHAGLPQEDYKDGEEEEARGETASSSITHGSGVFVTTTQDMYVMALSEDGLAFKWSVTAGGNGLYVTTRDIRFAEDYVFVAVDVEGPATSEFCLYSTPKVCMPGGAALIVLVLDKEDGSHVTHLAVSNDGSGSWNGRGVLALTQEGDVYLAFCSGGPFSVLDGTDKVVLSKMGPKSGPPPAGGYWTAVVYASRMTTAAPVLTPKWAVCLGSSPSHFEPGLTLQSQTQVIVTASFVKGVYLIDSSGAAPTALTTSYSDLNGTAFASISSSGLVALSNVTTGTPLLIGGLTTLLVGDVIVAGSIEAPSTFPGVGLVSEADLFATRLHGSSAHQAGRVEVEVKDSGWISSTSVVMALMLVAAVGVVVYSYKRLRSAKTSYRFLSRGTMDGEEVNVDLLEVQGGRA